MIKDRFFSNTLVAARPGAAEHRRFGDLDCIVRELKAGDEHALQDFFASHTQETVYERYGNFVSSMSPQRASSLVNVDQTSDRALGAFVEELGGEKLQAVGRYCLDPDGRAAEVAFVVRESMRNRGVATALLDLLIRCARERGLLRLWAQVAVGNSRMLHIFHARNFVFTSSPGSGEISVSLSLNVSTAFSVARDSYFTRHRRRWQAKA